MELDGSLHGVHKMLTQDPTISHTNLIHILKPYLRSSLILSFYLRLELWSFKVVHVKFLNLNCDAFSRPTSARKRNLEI
jgi:hypothetical protein